MSVRKESQLDSFSDETCGLYEETPSVTQSPLENIACMHLEATPRAEQHDSKPLLQNNVTASLLRNSFDQTTYLNDEAEACVLDPVDINTVGKCIH
jgi:hypothetical protein